MKALRTLLAAAAVLTLSATLSAQDINQQLEPEDKAIICAMVDKNFNQHLNPAHGIDDMKIIDLLEEYGDDHDLGEGWWMEEHDIDDIVLLIQFEN